MQVSVSDALMPGALSHVVYRNYKEYGWVKN